MVEHAGAASIPSQNASAMENNLLKNTSHSLFSFKTENKSVQPSAGDWVMIRSGDPEFGGQVGVILDIDGTNGLLEVSVPRLGIQVSLPQQHASNCMDPPEALKRVRLICGGYEDALPARKRQSTELSSAPTHLPAHIPPLFGKGASRMKDVLKQVRKELLSMEENIGWEKVDKSWKGRRTPWIKGLKAIATLADPPPISPPLEPHPMLHVLSPRGEASGNSKPDVEVIPACTGKEVALLAGALADLHEALKTDKAMGRFKRGGSWEKRLCELADGGNNYQALWYVWEEMRQGVLIWLEGELPLEAGIGPEGSQNNNVHGAPNQGSGQGHLAGFPPGISQAVSDRLVYAAARRAVAALHAASLQGADMIDQVPLDKIIGPSKAGFAMVRALVEQEREVIRARMAKNRMKDRVFEGEAQIKGGEEPNPSSSQLQLESLLSSRMLGELKAADFPRVLLPLGDAEELCDDIEAEVTDLEEEEE